MKRSKWREHLPRGRLDPQLYSWLVEPGSLTTRLQRCSRSFRVRLLSYRLGQPLPDEAIQLEAGRHLAHVREVLLECDAVPVIFAHTMLSTATNGRLGRWLARLGTRSLGSLLFAHPGFNRGVIEFIRLDPRHPLFVRAVRAADLVRAPRHLWARRSLHVLAAQRVLVTEVFLPPVTLLQQEMVLPDCYCR
ncbi:chorismate lyase [Dechloromonas denitrificans]|uniref:chorismate--pyruvate lyase family protein n=1 Tax=Dechloromonas denitrificans TaxID=281362 RepID=UPI001CF8400C|nr:chorismate lyase [Dechloromonas denitrificans]UCV12436.1 chorismate lyase [Dechloromonas denitrificans]